MSQTDLNQWRLLQTGRNDGAFNMALDEALLQTFSAHLSLVSPLEDYPVPIVRFYGWQPACLSLGYTQRAEREVDVEACARLGIDWVRRHTGGRAILHDYAELTYSVVAASADPLFGNGILPAYRTISGALLDGLRRLGVEADLAPKVSAKEMNIATAACFDAPSSYEITAKGRKLIGSAQFRNSTAFLQQGTILLGVDVPKLFEVLKPPVRLSRAQAIAQVSQRLTSIEAVCSQPVAFEEAQTAFVAGFASYFGADLQPSAPTQAELELTQALKIAKYANPAWNMERQRPRQN